MTWLIWRQHRTQAIAGAAALATLAVLLLTTGLQMASQYHSALAACTTAHTCANLPSTLFLGSHAVGFLVIMTLGVPALLGVFWGAPLVAAELETGTSQFAWMQTVTRKHWLTVKAGWILLAAAAWAGAISALVTWWSGPDNALQLDAFNPGRFDIMGIVPVGYALFATALGIAAGAVARRTVPALAVTLAVFIAARFMITELARPHYMTAITTTGANPHMPPGSWQLARGMIGPDGNVLPPAGSTCLSGCVVKHGYRAFITYQPAGRYWTFQGIETGIFVLLAAALIAITAIVVLRHDA